MDEVKDDYYYLAKIKDDLEFIMNKMSNLSQQEFAIQEILIDSMMFRLIQVAENNERLSAKFKNENKDIPWHAIKGMRNRIVHDYGCIDLTMVYNTLTKAVPLLYERIIQFV